jgi:hypothetical protein
VTHISTGFFILFIWFGLIFKFEFEEMQFTFGSGRSWVGVGEVDELAEEAKRVDGKWRWKIIPLQSALLAINEFLLTLIWFTFFFAFFFLLTRECLMIGIYEFNNRL